MMAHPCQGSRREVPLLVCLTNSLLRALWDSRFPVGPWGTTMNETYHPDPQGASTLMSETEMEQADRATEPQIKGGSWLDGELRKGGSGVPIKLGLER